jgi:hypothetical protein
MANRNKNGKVLKTERHFPNLENAALRRQWVDHQRFIAT